jgi:hypothetical protein
MVPPKAAFVANELADHDQRAGEERPFPGSVAPEPGHPSADPRAFGHTRLRRSTGE